MLSATRATPRTLHAIVSRTALPRRNALFSSSSTQLVAPNPKLNLDPTLDAFLHDLDFSKKGGRRRDESIHKELEVVTEGALESPYTLDSAEWSPMQVPDEYEEYTERTPSKSPAALFGSDQIGSVILPHELMAAVTSLISDSSKSVLHSDAKRLFLSSDQQDGEGEWDTQFDASYRTRQQAARHAVRDGTAFATVALPAHFSAITSVLHHAKVRLGPSWDVERVMDWGAATGSGLWASVYAFQQTRPEIFGLASNSTIKHYTGIDKREGLTHIGRRIVNKIPNETVVEWQKNYTRNDKLSEEDAHNTIALSAFTLATLPSAVAQKTMVEEMWTSGAHTIVLIDHDTAEGFEAVARAREHLLKLSKLEQEDPEYTPSSRLAGCHVLAPCPHDRPCPLLHSGGVPLICGFSQRIQRPPFVQKTKHSGVGHEDVRYSYVVIRRGSRPDSKKTEFGRIGGIGQRVLDKERSRGIVKELELHNEELVESAQGLQEIAGPLESAEPIGQELHGILRREAYSWPRLVFPPLKKSGHIILDVCNREGKIMRMTVPKSQGKQPFYDARKSAWGDIFPHDPKSPPQERYQPKVKKQNDVPTGDDIGKRKQLHKLRQQPAASYEGLAENLREKKKLSKREYARKRGDKVWHTMLD